MLDQIVEYFSFPFVRNALVAGVLISLSAALLGVPLVLKRLSFIGDGLSIACALVLLKSSRNAKTAGDATLAMLSVGAMAIGYLLMNLKPSSSNVSGDVCTTLFGSVSILTLTDADLWLCVGLSVGVVVCWLLSYHRLFDVTFDESHAKACGTNTTLFNAIWAVVVAVVIVISMRLVGTLLVTAILVFPAVAAMRIAKSFRAVTTVAATFSVLCSAIGILVAVVAGTPVGSTIVGVDIIAFLLISTIGRLLK